MKPQKIVIFSLIVICVTLLLFTWITRVHSVNSILNEVIPNHYDYNI
ncbi:Hok/Gef family protein [Photorhabdus luminescens]